MKKKNRVRVFSVMVIGLVAHAACARADITDVVSKSEFLLYKDVGEFIDNSPKVTVVVPVQQSDVDEYGQGVVKTLTGSDCDRDGKMDDNPTCNAVYYKLWLKYRLNNARD